MKRKKEILADENTLNEILSKNKRNNRFTLFWIETTESLLIPSMCDKRSDHLIYDDENDDPLKYTNETEKKFGMWRFLKSMRAEIMHWIHHDKSKIS